MRVEFGLYELLLMIAVSLMGVALAYLHHPKWKAMTLSLPIPFTLAVLSLGSPVGITNVTGLLVLLLYTHGVRIMYQRLRVPIFPAIALGIAGYLLLGILLARVLPTSEAAFWTISAVIFLFGVVLHRLQPPRDEPGHRTLLPVWIKLPVILGVVFLLVVIKQSLQGFMTLFPMVGMLASYEARHSLWTISKQIPVLMITMTPMIAVIHLAQGPWGAGLALAAGWATLFVLLVPLTRDIWSTPITALPAAAAPTGETKGT